MTTPLTTQEIATAAVNLLSSLIKHPNRVHVDQECDVGDSVRVGSSDMCVLTEMAGADYRERNADLCLSLESYETHLLAPVVHCMAECINDECERHQQATIVTTDLEIRSEMPRACRAVKDGISLRVIGGFNFDRGIYCVKLDVLYGFAESAQVSVTV